jgi:hypothetical protein
MAPVYVYSADEKRCVYKGKFLSLKGSIFEYLIDTTTEEKIADYFMVNGDVTHGDLDGFNEAHRRYFLTTPAR